MQVHELENNIAKRTNEPAEEGRDHTIGASHTEVGYFEDFAQAESAAKHVIGFDIAMDDADFVDGRQSFGQAFDGMCSATHIEGLSNVANGILDSIGEGSSFESTMHIFDGDPEQFEGAKAFAPYERASVNQSNNEGSRGHALVEPSESNGLFLHDESGLWTESAHKSGTQDLENDRTLAVGTDALRQKGNGHGARTDFFVDAIPHVG